MALITLNKVSKKYKRGSTALRDVSLSIEQGEFIYLVGPSGAGKSSLIKLLYREETATRGSIKLGDLELTKLKKRQVPQLRRRIGVIFQDYKLLQRKTVAENVAFAMEVVGSKRKDIKKRVPEVLALVGLKHKARSFPEELSGGEQQRVAIARAIVNNPKLLIADEPTGNLDPEISEEIMRLLEQINRQGTTIIMATHNNQLVDTFKHRVLEMEAGRLVRDQEGGNYGYAE